MGNKSAEDPAGRLTHDHLMHFDGLMGEDGEGGGRVGRGWERIPDGFHRRKSVLLSLSFPGVFIADLDSDADLYSIPYFQTDLLQFQAIDPRTVSSEVPSTMNLADSHSDPRWVQHWRSVDRTRALEAVKGN